MSLTNPKLLSALAAFAFLLLLIGWLAGFFETKIDPTLLETERTVVDPESLYRVTAETVQLNAAVPGSVVARDDTIISSRILARVNRVLVRPGDTVTKGQPLIELEQADLRSRVAQAKDQVASITAQHEEARLRLERTSELLGRGLAARADLDTARAAFDTLGAQLNNAKESLTEAEIILGYSEIKAPISGRVVERLAEPGDTVSPGVPLISVYDPVSIRAEAAVRESLALKLALGQEISVELPSLNQTVTGVIEEIVPAADSASRSFLIKASIEYNPALMPGMFARFVIPDERRELLLIPANAVIEVGELNLVSVLSNGQLINRFVRLGRSQPGGQLVVTAGLAEGDRIVAAQHE
ncbi:MAG: efflux RND transporter periplasmic adaptor subunit [Pseudomonadota bacterium]